MHVWVFFDDAVPAALACRLGSYILTETMERHPDVGFDSYDRFFTNQDTLPRSGSFRSGFCCRLKRASHSHLSRPPLSWWYTTTPSAAEQALAACAPFFPCQVEQFLRCHAAHTAAGDAGKRRLDRCRYRRDSIDPASCRRIWTSPWRVASSRTSASRCRAAEYDVRSHGHDGHLYNDEGVLVDDVAGASVVFRLSASLESIPSRRVALSGLTARPGGPRVTAPSTRGRRAGSRAGSLHPARRRCWERTAADCGR
jgi:hypothetical protein